MSRKDIEYSYSLTTYVFMGRKLPKPDPSTYDAAHFTPPEREKFEVLIYDSGLWSLNRGDVIFDSGSGASRSQSYARSIVERYLEKMEKCSEPPF